MKETFFLLPSSSDNRFWLRRPVCRKITAKRENKMVLREKGWRFISFFLNIFPKQKNVSKQCKNYELFGKKVYLFL